MAERRMFAKTIIDSDSFLDMPMSTQCLYFHLSMRADDEGFINNPKKVQRMIGASDDDMKLLIAKNFLITFDTGVVVIKHWRIHNYIRNDRFKPTVYQEEKTLLAIKDNGAYTLETLGIPSDNQVVYQMDTQVRLGKDSIGKDRLECKANKFAPPTLEDIKSYIKEKNYNVDADKWLSHYQSNGWMVGKNKMKDWKASIRYWASQEKKQDRGLEERSTNYDALESELIGYGL